MKQISIVITLLVALNLNSYAQVPGYMGKRLSIGYSNYLSPSLLNPSATKDRGDLGLNTTHCINLEYTIKKRTDFCFGIQFSKTGMSREIGFTHEGYDNNGYKYVYNSSYSPVSKMSMQLSTTNICLGFKFFSQGYIAPVGKYKKLDFILLLNKVSYERGGFRNDSPPAEYVTLGTGANDFRAFAIALTFGRQRVLFNTLLIDTGFRVGISPNIFISYIKNDVINDQYNLFFEDQLKESVNQRIFAAQLVNFHIGIGFLAF